MLSQLQDTEVRLFQSDCLLETLLLLPRLGLWRTVKAYGQARKFNASYEIKLSS